MYDVVTVTCGSFEHTIVLSTVDTRLLALLEPKLSTESVQVIQNVFLRSHRTRASSLARRVLIRATEEVVGAIDGEDGRLGFIYSAVQKDDLFTFSGCGTTSGIRMPDDGECFYSLKTGAGICNLERCGVDQTGRGYVIETTDCRDRARLVTENMGEITIKKRKFKLTLPILLRDLLSALCVQDCDDLSLSYIETARHP
jgi:hypothetical protein